MRHTEAQQWKMDDSGQLQGHEVIHLKAIAASALDLSMVMNGAIAKTPEVAKTAILAVTRIVRQASMSL